jgi:hypothetical protein
MARDAALRAGVGSALLAAFAFALTDCASVGSDDGPGRLLAAYRAALLSGDADQAYRLHDAAFRASHDPAVFRARWDQEVAERRAWAALLERPGEGVELDLGQGRRLVLRKDGGAWHIAEGGVAAAAARETEPAAPAWVLGEFLRAASERDLTRIRPLMPEAAQARWDDRGLGARLAEMEPRIAEARRRLSAATPAPEAVIEGDRAFVRYGKGRAARLVREAGRWRVVDVE